MQDHPTLVAQFDQLTAPLTVSGLQLTVSVQRLQEIATLAVRSLLGWSLAVSVNGRAVTLTSLQPWVDADEVRASLRVPLGAFLTEKIEGALVFYAAAPHAFSRLAVDLVATFGPARCRLRRDQDLNPDLVRGLTGVHCVPSAAEPRSLSARTRVGA
jgi:hypothetical protein